MNIKRALTVSQRIVFSLKNDIRTLVLIFFAPIIAMFVFGLAFSGDVQHVKVGVVNYDEGFSIPFTGNISISANIINNMDKDAVDIIYLETEKDAVRMVKEGQIYGAIIFPPDFTGNLYVKMNKLPLYSQEAKVRIRLDRTIFTVANAVVQTFINAMMVTIEQTGNKLPIKVDLDDPIYGKNAKFMDFFVPGIMGFASFFLTALLTILSFVGEKKTGTLERLLATPLTESELITGYTIIFGIIGIIQSILLLSVATLVFHITIVGNIFLAFIIISILSIVSLSLGILLSTLAKNEIQAIQMVPLIVLPTFLLAGVFWPVEAIPLWLKPLSYIIPPYYAIDACRSVMIRGWGIEKIWINLVSLIVFGAIFFNGAIFSLKRIKE